MPSERLDVQEQAAWLAQGYIQGQRDLLLHQLEARFTDHISPAVRTRVARAAPDALDAWGVRVLDAPDLDAVFEEEEE